MKILFLLWESLGSRFVINALKKKNYEVVLYPFSKDEAATDKEKITVAIAEKLLKESYDYVFSFNYFSVAAIACKACNITYISWVYDNPCIELYDETIKYETNRVFVFDSSECRKFRALGINTLHYLPLASAPDYYESIIKKSGHDDKYSCDIAFVGATKTEKDTTLWRFEKLSEYTKGYFDAVINAQKSIYGYNFIENILTTDILEDLNNVYPLSMPKDSLITNKWIYANYYMYKKVTGKERVEILDMLSHKYNVNLYTLEPTPYLTAVKNKGEVNYYTEAPLVYNHAKINLNISLKSITSGIPLRAMDIMGAGGFLLTNFQQDFLEFFTPGEDFVYYESYEDLMNKAEYYLIHERERKEISANALEKIKKNHTYESRIDILFK